MPNTSELFKTLILRLMSYSSLPSEGAKASGDHPVLDAFAELRRELCNYKQLKAFPQPCISTARQALEQTTREQQLLSEERLSEYIVAILARPTMAKLCASMMLRTLSAIGVKERLGASDGYNLRYLLRYSVPKGLSYDLPMKRSCDGLNIFVEEWGYMHPGLSTLGSATQDSIYFLVQAQSETDIMELLARLGTNEGLLFEISKIQSESEHDFIW